MAARAEGEAGAGRAARAAAGAEAPRKRPALQLVLQLALQLVLQLALQLVLQLALQLVLQLVPARCVRFACLKWMWRGTSHRHCGPHTKRSRRCAVTEHAIH